MRCRECVPVALSLFRFCGCVDNNSDVKRLVKVPTRVRSARLSAGRGDEPFTSRFEVRVESPVTQ